MTPSFFIEATGETVLVKPNGSMEFFGEEGLMKNAITFSSETAAVEYAKARGWRENIPAV